MSLKHQLTQSTFEDILTEKDTGGDRSGPGSGVWTCYSAREILRTPVAEASGLSEAGPEGTRWLHWSGLGHHEQLTGVFDRFGIDTLMAEDILNTESRSKMEETSEGVFVVIKLPVAMEEAGKIEAVHFCALLQEGLVLSFSEIPLKFLADLDRRLDDRNRKIRKLGSDYLYWALIDLVIDHSMRFVDHLTDQVEGIEDELIESRSEVSMETIHGTKNEVSQTYRLLRPTREMTSQLCSSDSELLSEKSNRYFQDLHDHAAQTVDVADHLRDKASSLQELYYTLMSHRMNEVMKVLTSLSAIFLPLTFLAGLYGMNFAYMPELGWRWSYPLFMGILATIATVLIVYFKRKKWL